MRVTGLFAGIGGIELGFERAGGFETEMFCELWDPARAVLAAHFGLTVDDIWPDVTTLSAIPGATDVVTAGFPCTDLSQAGRMAGIGGKASGLVSNVFRLLHDARDRGRLPSWLVIENVPNMLQLDGGQAMRYLVRCLERMGMRWAYRVVDSRFTGVPQRRRRVLLVASATEDPRAVLFADEAGERLSANYAEDAYGFYWTEGRGGLGWARDATPTLKGGSTVGIPSPPAVWVPAGSPGRRLLTPSITDAEAMQGFPRGWTGGDGREQRNGPRWKLVGNAVTVGVAEWLGRRLATPGDWTEVGDLWDGPKSWPTSAWGEAGKVWQVRLSEFPERQSYQHLLEVMDEADAFALSHRGAAGFWGRLQEGNLGRHPGFREAVAEHVRLTNPVPRAARIR
jgi:DNA (cytosine-5)-methyltransferase 1